MKIDIKEFRVPEGKTVNLKKWPTRVKPSTSRKNN